MSVEASNK